MSIDEISKELPNGFHDAFLRGLAIDYLNRIAKFDLELLVGDPESNDEIGREAYRRASLSVTGLTMFAADMQSFDLLEENANGVSIGLAPSDEINPLVNLVDSSNTASVFQNSFYCAGDEWPRIHIGGIHAEIEWLTGPRLIY